MENRNKWIPRLAWGLCILNSAGALVILGDVLAARGTDEGSLRLAGNLTGFLFPLVVSLLAAFILARQPRNPIGWLLMIPASASVFGFLANIYLGRLPSAPSPASLPALLLVWFSNWSWVLFIFPLVLIPLLFPTGAPPSPRWRWVFWVAIGLCGFFILLASFARELGPLEGPDWVILNPIGFLPDSAIEVVIFPWLLSLGLLTLLCVASLFIRYRSAGTVEREQIKWLLYAVGIFAANYVPGLFLNSAQWVGLAKDAWELLFSLTTLAIPVSIAIAITRYRLWDIDVIIRRTLIYGVLTAALALVYGGMVIVLQEVFRALTGSQGQSQLAIVVSTLAVAALFNPLRNGVQERIDRRFYRRRYDAERVLEAFAEKARQEPDLESLTGQLAEAVQSSLQPQSISLWLKKPGRQR